MQDTLIIIGAGNVGHSDLETLKHSGEILVVGKALLTSDFEIDAFAMWRVDGHMFNAAMDRRKKENLNTDFKCYSFLPTSGFIQEPQPLYGAGSVMYAIQLGISLDYDKIILVDCPLDDYCEAYQKGFKEAFPLIQDKVRSLSGFTKELFGEPDDNWINT